MKSNNNPLSQMLNLQNISGNYIIDTDQPALAARELSSMLAEQIFKNPDLASNPDYLLIDEDADITTASTTQLKNFLTTMPLAADKKIAVIVRAESMNIYAANSCLKVLEDTPQFAHIFLICQSSASMLPTILSRCFKITHKYEADNKGANTISYEDFIKNLLDKGSFLEKYLSAIKSKQAEEAIFHHFLRLVNNICKRDFDSTGKLSAAEGDIKSKFFSKLPVQGRINKYNKISQLIKNQRDYKLDAGRCFLLLCHEIYS